jgi:hypothetical protein
MLLSKPCKFLNQRSRCLRTGSYCDPYCNPKRCHNPDASENPEEEGLIQGKGEFVWFEKGSPYDQ